MQAALRLLDWGSASLVLACGVACGVAVALVCARGLETRHAMFATGWAFGAAALLYAFATLLTLEAFASWLCITPPASLAAASERAEGSAGAGEIDARIAPPPSPSEDSLLLLASPYDSGGGGWSSEWSECDGSASSPSRRHQRAAGLYCCHGASSSSAAPPLMFACAFATRTAWFALRYWHGTSGCAAGPLLLPPALAPALSGASGARACATTDPCCHAYDGSTAAEHIGWGGVISRIGTGILVAAFAAVGISWLRIADDVRAVFEPARLGGGGGRQESLHLRSGADQRDRDAALCGAQWWASCRNAAALCGDRIALCVLIALSFWVCAFEAAVVALRVRLHHSRHVATRGELCFATRAHFAEKITVALMFGLLGVVLLSQGARLLALIEHSSALGVEGQKALRPVRLKLRVITAAAFVGLTCVKCLSELLPVALNADLGDDLCTAASPWFFYTLGEIAPAMLIIATTSPRSLCRRASGACVDARRGIVSLGGGTRTASGVRATSGARVERAQYGSTSARRGLAV
jgi:hypothetical protein